MKLVTYKCKTAYQIGMNGTCIYWINDIRKSINKAKLIIIHIFFIPNILVWKVEEEILHVRQKTTTQGKIWIWLFFFLKVKNRSHCANFFYYFSNKNVWYKEYENNDKSSFVEWFSHVIDSIYTGSIHSNLVCCMYLKVN